MQWFFLLLNTFTNLRLKPYLLTVVVLAICFGPTNARAVDACRLINPYEIATLLHTDNLKSHPSDEQTSNLKTCVYEAAPGNFLILMVSDVSGEYQEQLHKTPQVKFTETPIPNVGESAVMWDADNGVQFLAKSGSKSVRIALVKLPGNDYSNVQQELTDLARHVLAADWAVPIVISAGPIRVVKEGSAKPLQKVTPVYPPLARQARIQGVVLLKALIGADGKIENLEVISGHPMLIQAAMDAVKQWVYEPYLLEGHAVPVETTIRVNFFLNEKGAPDPNSDATSK